ncbi:MAG TPA: oligosaccharide flippase family protein [Flavobacteriales bacterium]|nr:oligosaccharide flippase family protein [Flavobacteriales bacterium]
MNLRLIFKNTSLYALADIFNKGLSFLLLPFFTMYFTPTDYGVIDTFTIFQLILGILVNWEINQAIIRFVPESDPGNKVTFFSSALFFIGLNAAAFCLILLVFSPYFSNIVHTDLDPLIYITGIVNVFINILNSFFLLVSRTQLNAGLVFKATLANGIITVATACMLVLYFNLGLKGYFIAMLAGSACTLLVLFAGTFALFNAKQVKKNQLRSMLAFSIPLVPSALGVFLTIYIDRVIIKEYFSDHALGLFGIAYRFALIASILVGSYLSSIGPLIFRDYKNQNFNVILNGYLKIYVFISLILLAGYGLFSKEAILLFTSHDSFNASMQYIYLLSLNAIAFNFYVFFPSLSIAKKTFTISLINIGAALINLGLIMALIQYLDILGILLATLASTLTIQVLTWYFGHKQFPLEINSKDILQFIVFALVFGSINFIDLHNGPVHFNVIAFVGKLVAFIAFVWALYHFNFRKKTQ